MRVFVFVAIGLVLGLSACGSEPLSPDAEALYGDLVKMKDNGGYGCEAALENGVSRHADILTNDYPTLERMNRDDVIAAVSKFYSECESGALTGS